MLLGVISDIHANLPALEACLAQAEALGVDRLVFLGDVVGYGPDPEACVQRVRHLCEVGATAIRGNHDEAMWTGTAGMTELAARAIAWTAPRLSAQSISFLKALPLSQAASDTLFVHADASQPSRWLYVADVAAALRSIMGTEHRVTLCGHVHVPQLYCMTATGKIAAHAPSTGVAITLAAPRKWLGVAGSAGQPRDGNPAASFLTYDLQAHVLTYRRAPYDAEGVAERIRAAGLPDRLASRLTEGH